jgi:hypothetical protein
MPKHAKNSLNSEMHLVSAKLLIDLRWRKTGRYIARRNVGTCVLFLLFLLNLFLKAWEISPALT